MGVKSYKELMAWQLADELRREIYQLFAEGRAADDLRLRSQGEDAASSVCRNIAEGFVKFNPAEFARYARHAAGSLAELEVIIDDGLAKKYWTTERVSTAENLTVRAGTALGRLQRYLRSKQARRNAARIIANSEGQ